MIRSLSLNYTCLGGVPFLVFEVVVAASEKTLCVAQQLLEVWRGSISVNVIWHSTQRQLRGADDSAKPCLWRLHAWCCRAVIWSSHAKADRQTALSQAGRQPVSQSFHRDDNTSVSVKSVQQCLILNTFTGVSMLCRTDGRNTDRKIQGKHYPTTET